MSIALREHDAAAVRADAALRLRLGEIYADAFGRPPHDHQPREERAWAEETLRRHADYPGFALVTAEQGEQVVGFGYGLLGAEDQWFTQTLRTMLPESLAQAWLGPAGGQGELVELAVLGSAQGQGIGGRLHDAVLAQLRATGTDRALLVTHREAHVALALYTGRGWQRVADLESASVLMGIRLS